MGRRKLDKVQFPSYKVKPETLISLRKTAIQLGYTYAGNAAMGEFLDGIAALDPDLLRLVFKKSLDI